MADPAASTDDADLDHLLDRNNGALCSVCTALTELPQPTAEKFRRLLANESVGARPLREAFRARSFPVSREAVAKHRKVCVHD